MMIKYINIFVDIRLLLKPITKEGLFNLRSFKIKPSLCVYHQFIYYKKDEEEEKSSPLTIFILCLLCCPLNQRLVKINYQSKMYTKIRHTFHLDMKSNRFVSRKEWE